MKKTIDGWVATDADGAANLYTVVPVISEILKCWVTPFDTLRLYKVKPCKNWRESLRKATLTVEWGE